MAEEKIENKQTENDDYSLKWMIRPCDTYDDEYKDCTSIKARFHQYFVHGQTIDCNAWKTDYTNCQKWEAGDNPKAYKELIASEQKRRLERLRPHYQNDVWKKREAPPADWNKPLPAWLEEENKATYLALKSEELKSGEPKNEERSMCVIS